MSDLLQQLGGPTCTSCAEQQFLQNGTAALLPAYPTLTCVTYGKLSATQAGQDITVESGSCALFNAGEMVSLRATSEVPLTLIHAELANLDDALLQTYSLPLVLAGMDATRTREYLEQLLAVQMQPGKGSPLQRCRSAFLANGLVLLILEALEQVSADTHAPPPSPELQKIRAYCLEHLADRITIPDLQKLLSVSAAPLYAMVKKACGMSPMAYVRQIRLERALQLLQGTKKTIQQIAAECGYPSPFHFSRTFKKNYDLSPSAYRSQVHQETLSKGDVLMRQQDYRAAAEAYQKEIDTADDAAVHELRYKRGLAFFRSEQYDEALHDWQPLRDTPYWLKAVPDIIEILFRVGRFKAGGKLFREHYDEALEAGVQTTFRSLWHTWIRMLRRQCNTEHMEMFLQLRADLFPDDKKTAYDAHRCLLETGRGGEVPPDHPLHAIGLRHAGRFREILDSPHCSRKEKAKALLSMGEYQAVVDDYPDTEFAYATALGLLGQAETGLRLFAPGSEGYALSLFYNGDYDRILADCRLNRRVCCYACYMKKEPERIIDESIAGFWLAVPALCLLGRTREARDFVEGYLWEGDWQIAAIEAIQKLLKNDSTGAAAALPAIPETAQLTPGRRLDALPAHLVMAYLQNDQSDLADLEKMVTNPDHKEELARDWFQARLLFGAIDDQAYLAQPTQHPDPQLSLPLFQAIRDDLAGNATRAIDNYRTVFDRYSQNMISIGGYYVWHWYIKWRLRELG